LGELLNKICPISNETCSQVEYGGEQCVDKLTLEYAAICIKKLRAINLDTAREIEALDELVESLKEGKSSH
jgi:hypothetical protein